MRKATSIKVDTEVKEATSIKVNPEVWRKAKIEAINRRIGLSDYVMELIKKDLKIK